MAHLLFNSNSSESIPISVQIAIGLFALSLLAGVYSYLTSDRPIAGLPVLSVDGLKPKISWYTKGNETLEEGYKKYTGKPFQVATGTGHRIILPNRFANEVRNDNRLSLNGAFAQDFFAHYPGFEAIKVVFEHASNSLIQDTVRIRLTQSLGLITGDLVEEATDAVHDIFAEDDQWHIINVKNHVIELVARMSSRTFLGKPLCRNRQWLDVTSQYSVGIFLASRELRNVPVFARRVMQYFMPSCTKVREQYAIAKGLITAEVQRRTEAAQKALAAGKKPAKTADAIGWMVELSKGKNYDLVAGQLSLSVAAIQTTTEAMSHILVDICEHGEIIQSLREEIISVLREHGWSKVALHQMKLVDSVLKESQRLHRPRANLNRYAIDEVVLSDGTKIPKGSRLLVEQRMFDPELFPDPYTFNPYRFVELREHKERGNDWQFATVNSEFMAFGLGTHACPGRFFVSNEMKIALCHLLLKYDWRFVPGKRPEQPFEIESNVLFNPSAELQVRRRKEEVDLSAMGS
ncbi:hypothetical protein PRZ48_015005 [Zasmidium cellare]|uniref:Cytochrome P450 n=1 Tax=Zasmidium cellare TaxID=395010 RepID=A0ABR0DXG7_ZASCE|nr:hypothetical protein PRZ48_015005 [Zasmidium cellare]